MDQSAYYTSMQNTVGHTKSFLVPTIKKIYLIKIFYAMRKFKYKSKLLIIFMVKRVVIAHDF